MCTYGHAELQSTTLIGGAMCYEKGPHGKYSEGLTLYWAVSANIVGFLPSGRSRFIDVAPPLTCSTSPR